MAMIECSVAKVKIGCRQAPAIALVWLLAMALPPPASAANLTVTGVVRAQEEVILRSEFGGIVQRIAVREGERVREGQLLIELKNERQKISLDLSRARMAKANASVAETTVLLDNAHKDLKRVQIAADALPRKDLEDRGDQVLRLEAILEAQRAELAQAKQEVRLKENEVKETQLSAPFAGTVTQIFVNRGDTLKPTETQVAELVALDRLYVELLLPVAHVYDVSLGQTVKVRAESESAGRSLAGQIVHINPKVDAASRTFQVKVGFSNSDGRIKPGMLAQVDFPFQKK
jgi:RND family efflux transporter MFP subunit